MSDLEKEYLDTERAIVLRDKDAPMKGWSLLKRLASDEPEALKRLVDEREVRLAQLYKSLGLPY